MYNNKSCWQINKTKWKLRITIKNNLGNLLPLFKFAQSGEHFSRGPRPLINEVIGPSNNNNNESR